MHSQLAAYAYALKNLYPEQPLTIMKMINDWAPEVKDLLTALTTAGFTLSSGDNGEERFTFKDGKLDEFIANLIACDESRLYVKDPSGHKRWLYLVLGNSPGELVSDYSCPADDKVTNHLDPLVDAHYEKWSARTQPTKPSPYV